MACAKGLIDPEQKEYPMKKTIGLIFASSMLAGATLGWAAGYGILEGSARGNAMGTEVTADPASPSIIYNNPAAMTDLPGTQIEAGFTAIKPRQTIVTHTPWGSQYEHARSQWWTIPNAYLTREVSDSIWFGLGLGTRIGLGAEYPGPATWNGRYSVTRAEITSFEANPSLAWRVSTNFSVAAGVRVQYFDFLLRRAVPTGQAFADPDVSVQLTGDNIELGYNVGAYWKALPWLSVGAAYMSEIRQQIEGKYKVSTIDGGHPITGGTCYGNFPSPAEFRLGTSIKATDKLKVNLGLTYTFWNCYDQLRIHYDPAVLGRASVTESKKNWHDTWRWQLGLEYALTDAWFARCGYVYDKTPDPDYLIDYMVPANNRHIISFGGGWKGESFFCDFGYTYLIIEDRDVRGHIQDGVWDGKFQDGDAHMVSASVGYKF